MQQVYPYNTIMSENMRAMNTLSKDIISNAISKNVIEEVANPHVS